MQKIAGAFLETVLSQGEGKRFQKILKLISAQNY